MQKVFRVLLTLSLALLFVLIMAGCSNSMKQSEEVDLEKNSVSIAKTGRFYAIYSVLV